MKNTVVVGAQFGDEGKAKITDLLAQNADLIMRYQGGCNAGHTVVVDNKKYKFHLIPSGILYEDKICFIGAGVVIHPDSFKEELNALIDQGVSPVKIAKNLKISPLAHITMPYHIDLDGADEAKLGKNRIGTTKKGIGPTYADKYARLGIRVEDLFDEDILSNKLDIILTNKNDILEKIYGLKSYLKDEMMYLCQEYKRLFKPYVCFDWQDILRDAKKNKTILFEGAQGVLLDVDYGTYPYVTSSNPIGGGAAVGGSMGTNVVEEVIGVFKAYMTRVGEGDMITEQFDEVGLKLQEIGAEFGTTTGRLRRCGYFDAVIAKYSVLVGGLTSIALTKLDVYDTFEEIKLCVAYKHKTTGEIITMYPTQVQTHKDYAPVWESFEGWMSNISACRTYDELPKNAKIYLKRIEELLEIPIKIISVGADREQTIFVN